MKTKESFTTVNETGEPVELCVIYPSAKVFNEAQLIYSSAWRQAATPVRDKDGKLVRLAAPLRIEIEKQILPEHSIWGQEQEEEYKLLQKQLLDGERKLAGGASEFASLEEASAVAFDMKRLRLSLNELILRRSALDDNSAESFAEMARLNYLIYACTVYNNNNAFYNSLDNYYARQNEKASGDAAGAMLKLLNNTNLSLANKTPENEFLRKYSFIDSDYRRINVHGHLTDDAGKLIDAEGYWVDSEGQRVDFNGNRIDDKGDYVVDFKPFTDEFGDEIIPKE